MIFFVDAMLGHIARKLRLLGFDSEYFADIEDSKLIEKAQTECRTIISRDHALIQRAKKKGIPTVYVSKEDKFEQFLEIIKTTGIKIKKFQGTRLDAQNAMQKHSELINPKSRLKSSLGF